MTPQTKSPLEDVFCSKMRIKILKLLMELSQLNVSEIAHRVCINYASTLEHLRTLESEGIIMQRKYGRVHLYRLNENSQKASAMKEVIEVWNCSAQNNS